MVKSALKATVVDECVALRGATVAQVRTILSLADKYKFEYTGSTLASVGDASRWIAHHVATARQLDQSARLWRRRPGDPRGIPEERD